MSDPQNPVSSIAHGETRVGAGVLPEGVGPEDIRLNLEILLKSPIFSRSRRLGAFLRFVVEESLAGRSDELKEYLIGIEVFHRQKSYDPRTDPIVRVEAGRLREKLAEYYSNEGAKHPVHIELPKGRYSPAFVPVVAAIELPVSELPPIGLDAPVVAILQRPWIRAAMVALLLVLSVSTTYLVTRSAAAISPKASEPGSSSVISIAVLPFNELSPGIESDQAYFSAGLTEELINALTRVKGLRVAPKSSTARLSGVNADIRQIGRNLNVAAVLDGSVRRDGDRMRIAVRVTDVAKGYTLWSEMYERHLRDIFAVQEEISQKVVSSLGERLARGLNQPITRPSTASVEAYNFYLKGRYHWNRRGQEALYKAIGYFEQAIQEEPNYAAAYSGLADCWGGLAHLGSQAPSEVLPRAKAAALKALQIDPDLAEAHSSLGLVQMFYDWNLGDAEQSLKRAMKIDPQYATAYQWYSVLLMMTNQLDGAMVYVRRAEELEPLRPNVKRAVGDTYYRKGDYDRAIQKCQEALDLDFRLDSAHICIGRSYEKKGMYREAISAFQKGFEVSARPAQLMAMIAHANALSGNRAEAKKLVAELERRAAQTYMPPFHLAIAYAGLADADASLMWLDKAVNEHSVWIVGLAGDPRFEFLRTDPRFHNLVQRLPAF